MNSVLLIWKQSAATNCRSLWIFIVIFTNKRHRTYSLIIIPTFICWKFSEVAENGFYFFLSHHRIESAEGVANSPQIRAGFLSSHNDHLPGAFKFAQRVEVACRLAYFLSDFDSFVACKRYLQFLHNHTQHTAYLNYCKILTTLRVDGCRCVSLPSVARVFICTLYKQSNKHKLSE